VRKVLAALGVLAVGIAASSCSNASSGNSATSSTSSSIVPGSQAAPVTLGPGKTTAAKTLKAALANGKAQASLHYVSTSVGQGLTTTIVGDVNQTSGTQTIVVSQGKATARIVIELIGHEAYFRGDAGAIEVLIGLSGPEAEAAGGQWVSVQPSDSVYASTAAALTVGSLISELALTPPISGGRSTVVGGRTLDELSGTWVGEGVSATDHATATLEVTSAEGTGVDAPLPVRFSGVMPASKTASRFASSIAVSLWGEHVRVVPPTSSVPLSTIIGGSTPTTQPPTVV
jgi:hypothetical protein